MGFLDFWARRPTPVAEPEVLQARAYNAMLPAEAPILGTYPVAGNGQNILEQFQKAHPQIDVFDQSAPPPAIPRMRGGSLGRPNTAPSNKSNNNTIAHIGGSTNGSSNNIPLPLARPPAPRTDVAKALPPTPKGEKAAPKGLTVDVPKKRLGPPYKLPPKSPSQASFRSDNYTLGAPSPRLLPPDAAGAASIRSGTSQQSKGHMDLLDYHSALGTSDFYGRVQAGGTKNFGEDVADRNMGQNGVELKSSKARQFYSKNFGRGAPVDTRTASFAEEPCDETPRRSRSSKHSSMGSSTRSKSLTSNNLPEEPQRKKGSSRVPPIPAEYLREQAPQKYGPKTATRRRSMPSYAPAPTSRASSTRSQRRIEREREERERREREAQNFPDSLRDRAAAASYYNSEDDDYYGTDSSTSSSPPPPPPPPKYKKSHSPKRSRTSLRQTAESNPRHFVNHRRDNTMVYREDWGNSPNRSSRHDTVSSNPSVRASKSLSNRRSLHNVRSSDDYEQAPLAEQRRSGRSQGNPSRHRSMRRDLGSTTDAPASPLESLLREPAQPRPVTSHARMTNLEGQKRRPRNKSIQSTVSGKNTTHLDVEDSIPERTSSIRNWSMTSGTATTTTQSSNIFRPHSSHTANTSVDLTPFTQFFTAGHAHQKDPSSLSHSTVAENTASENLVLSSMAIPDIPPFIPKQPFRPHAQQDLLHFDDGTSVYSDASSSLHGDRKNSEEGLLFNDQTFGQDAFHLPGLFDANDSESPADSSFAQEQHPIGQSFHVDNFSSYGDGLSENSYLDDDNLGLDIPFRRSDTNNHFNSKDGARFRGGSSPIMEELDSLTSASEEDIKPIPVDKGKGKAVAIGAY